MPVGGLAAAGLGIVGGGLQAIFSGKRKAEKNLENLANSYSPNSSILDLYNEARNKYNANPYASIGYQNATNNINRNLATGLANTQDKRGGLATVGALVTGANTADAQASAQADAQSNAALGQLSRATQMKAAEDYKPFEMKFNLAALKASAANAQQSAGLSNMFNGLGNAGKLMGGSGSGGGGSSNGSFNPTRQGFNSMGYATGVF